MNLNEILSPENVSLNISANAKDDVIVEMLSLLDATGVVKDVSLAERDVMRRERELSTGLANGIAFPHAKTTAVDKLSVAVGLKPGGVDFESLDGNPSEVILLSLVPPEYNDQYLAFMAAVNIRLTDPDVRNRLINAGEASEVIKLLAADPA